MKHDAAGEKAAATAAMTAAPEGEKKRRTKLVRVKEGYIQSILEQIPTPRPYPVMSDEALQAFDKLWSDPKDREEFRALQAKVAALSKKMRDEDADVLHQYRTKGYAVQEVEIGDDDDDDDDEGCGGEEAEVATAGVVAENVGACKL
ncbi:hypothetical protein ACP70R_008715 [Stipagrostis hirtigluma subsp. patula]